MMNETTGGVSKRSLILLGGLAALALNRDLRRNLILGTRSALNNAQHTLDDTLKPALDSAAHQAQHLAHVAAHQAENTWETLRDEGPNRAQTLLDTVQEVLGTLAASAADRATHLKDDAASAAQRASKEYAPKIAALTSEVQDAAQDVASGVAQRASKAAQQARKEYAPKLAALSDTVLDAADDGRAQASKALRKARKQGLSALAELGDRASTLVDDASESLQDHRRDAERAIARARRDAEKELRRGKKNWNAKKLERAIEKRIAPVYKQVQHEFVRLEKQAGKKGHQLEARLRPAPKRNTTLGGSATAFVLLGTGAVVLARVPAARQGVLKAVEAVSPEAAQKLHQASRQVRNLVGDMWLETAEEVAKAPGAAPATQAATTGASAAANFEPGSAAAKPAESKPTETKPAESKADSSSQTKSN